jgi:DNA polymerase-3 subunit delta
MAAASGQGAQAISVLDRSLASGDSPQAVIVMLQRHLLQLHQVRVSLDAGRPATEAMRALRPPAFQKRADAILGQSRLWSAARLQLALGRCAAAAKAARLDSGMEVVYAERLLLAVSGLATARDG